MADDIDDLLDEVESKFCTTTTTSEQKKRNTQNKNFSRARAARSVQLGVF